MPSGTRVRPSSWQAQVVAAIEAHRRAHERFIDLASEADEHDPEAESPTPEDLAYGHAFAAAQLIIDGTEKTLSRLLAGHVAPVFDGAVYLPGDREGKVRTVPVMIL